MERTTGGPRVMLGTKCPSMTSTWTRPAPPRPAAAISSPSRAKSADRIEGARITGAPAREASLRHLADLEAHGAVVVDAVAGGRGLAEHDAGGDSGIRPVPDLGHLQTGGAEQVEGLGGRLADEVGHQVLVGQG